MVRHRERRAVYLLVAGTVALVLVDVVRADVGGDLMALLIPLAFLGVGALVGLRQPRNAEGLLLLVTAAAWAIALALPFDGSWVIPVALMTTHLLLRFPDGRLPSPRWKAFSWFCVVMPIVVATVVSVSSQVDTNGEVNPYYVAWTAALNPVIVLLPLGMVVSAGSLFVRYRQSGPVERQQVRWLAFTGSAVVVWYIITLGVSLGYDQWLGADSSQQNWFDGGYPLWLLMLQSSALLSFILIPMAFGVAILRYRLYDIDRIISRTTSYALVTGLVVGFYFLVVTTLGQLLPDSNELVVAAATLVAAAVFRPVLRVVRNAIDRRFNRSNYDHQFAVEAFSGRLRDEVGTEVVIEDFAQVIDSAFEPSVLGVWIAETTVDP